MTRLLVVQHLPHEHEGVLGEVLVTRDLDVVRCRAWAEPVPTTLEGMDALVVLGVPRRKTAHAAAGSRAHR